MLDRFFFDLLDQFREHGCECAVTGGLACVEFGIVEHTSDCDILCRPDQTEPMLKVLQESHWQGIPCQFRGSMSAPLDERWLEGGWTCHFSWGADAYLDVFGVPPRVRRPWWRETDWPYATRSAVAEMKRTRRPKDWSQATALGLQMLERKNLSGWLHIFDAEVMERLWESLPPSDQIVQARPALQLVGERAAMLSRVVRTEIEFWSELDRLRILAFRSAARDYAALVRAELSVKTLELLEQNALRKRFAVDTLPVRPVSPELAASIVEQATNSIAIGLDPAILTYLPTVGPNFEYKEIDR